MFFYKIGGMVGMECAYDFLKLVNCTNALDHVHAIDYGGNGFKFGKVHNKMENVGLYCILCKKVNLLLTWLITI